MSTDRDLLFAYDLDLVKHPINDGDINRRVIYENNDPALFSETKINCLATHQYVPFIRKYEPKTPKLAIRDRIKTVRPMITDHDLINDECNWLISTRLFYNYYHVNENSDRSFYMMRIVSEISRTRCAGCLYSAGWDNPLRRGHKYACCSEANFNVYEQRILELAISPPNEIPGIISPNFIFGAVKEYLYRNIDYSKHDSAYSYSKNCIEVRGKSYLFGKFGEAENEVRKWMAVKHWLHARLGRRLTADAMNYIGAFL